MDVTITTAMPSNIPVGGSKDAGKKFIDSITVYVNSTSGKPKDVTVVWPTFINFLMQLFIGNGILDPKTAGDLTTTFSKPVHELYS